MIKMQRMGLIIEIDETERDRMEANGWEIIEEKPKGRPKKAEAEKAEN